ncbi:IS630 family transposase [Gloeocapsa sp. PCC 7428]|uniref:IS630 family transposase n=1 Tax=Gloeocapsa sp. PCC 7428 TaxID=1173026 RepID=UPI0009DB61B0|nr:IS630 family transposase [Gloeocapsa sp. PCC 7428]
MLVWVAHSVLSWSGRGKIRFFCGDETRLGLKTLGGRRITTRGIKPIGQVQWQFEATYFYGVVEPQTGESFFYEFTHLNTDCFQVFLNLVSQQFTDDVLIIQFDNGAFHKAKRLQVPHNIILMFQPPHCPESNPIEQVWQYLKRQMRWTLPNNLEQLRQLLKEQLEKLTTEMIASITSRQSILAALSVAGL